MFNLLPEKDIDYITSYKKQEWSDTKSICKPLLFLLLYHIGFILPGKIDPVSCLFGYPF